MGSFPRPFLYAGRQFPNLFPKDCTAPAVILRLSKTHNTFLIFVCRHNLLHKKQKR